MKNWWSEGPRAAPQPREPLWKLRRTAQGASRSQQPAGCSVCFANYWAFSWCAPKLSKNILTNNQTRIKKQIQHHPTFTIHKNQEISLISLASVANLGSQHGRRHHWSWWSSGDPGQYGEYPTLWHLKEGNTSRKVISMENISGSKRFRKEKTLQVAIVQVNMYGKQYKK